MAYVQSREKWGLVILDAASIPLGLSIHMQIKYKPDLNMDFSSFLLYTIITRQDMMGLYWVLGSQDGNRHEYD